MRGRKQKGGPEDPTVSITVRIPRSKKTKLIQRASKCGYGDLSTYILKVLDEYTIEISLKKIEQNNI